MPMISSHSSGSILDDLQVVHVAEQPPEDAHEKRLPLGVTKSITQHSACFVGDGEVDVDEGRSLHHNSGRWSRSTVHAAPDGRSQPVASTALGCCFSFSFRK